MKHPTPSKPVIIRVRDAETGKFRPEWHAERWPKTTIVDRMPITKKGK